MDQTLFELLNRSAANPFFDWLMPLVTNLHHQKWFFGVVLLVCLFTLWKGTRRSRIWLLCALLAVGLSDVSAARLVKNVWKRDRPCRVLPSGQTSSPTVRVVGDCPGSASFPSNHAANMMALGGVCWWFSRGKHTSGKREYGLLWFLLPLVIGYSRIYLGYHYPTDVLGGWFLGAGCAWAVVAISKRFLKEPAT